MTVRRCAFTIAVVLLAVGCQRQSASTSASAELDPGRKRVQEFWLRFRAAEAERVAGRWSEAATKYRHALELNPQHEDSLYALGNCLLELQRWAEAERSFQRLVEIDAHSHRGFLQLGSLHLDPASPLYDPAAAIRAFATAHAINREETGALLGLAEAGLLTGELAVARARADEVLAANPKSREAHLVRAYTEWTAGHREAAGAELAAASGEKLAVRAELPASEGDTHKGSAAAGATAEVRDRGLLAEALAELAGSTGTAPLPEQVLARLHDRIMALQRR